MGKRGKVEKMGRRGKDGACINGLPDEILVRILCLLSLEEAIRTAILSRRWKNLWMNVPKLEISWRNDPYVFRPHEMSEVKAKVNFVNDFMKLHERTTTSLEELTICLPLDSKYSDDINKWAEVALSPSSIGLYWLKDLYLRGVNVVDKVAITICETFDFSHQLPELSTVEHLQIEFITLCPIWFDVRSQRLHHLWLCALLKTAPFLQKLSIKVMHIRDTVSSRHMELQVFSINHNAFCCEMAKVKALANAKWQYYSHQHLKEVELIDLVGSRNELEIVLFVLEIASLVEKVVISICRPQSFWLQQDILRYKENRRTCSLKKDRLAFEGALNTAISEGPNDLNLVNIDPAEEETMSPVDLRMMKSTDILTAMLGIMLIISLSELMSDMQGTQMKSDGTLEESGEAQRYRNFLEEMADESEHKSQPVEGGWTSGQCTVSNSRKNYGEQVVMVIGEISPDSFLLALDARLEHAHLDMVLVHIGPSGRNDAVSSSDHITSLRKICPMVSSEITFEASTAEVEGYGAPKLAVDHTVIYLQLVKSISRKLSSFTFVHAYSRQVKADELEPGVCYLQITATDPLMEDEDLGSRTERIFSLSTGSVRACVFDHFLFDTPFTKNGKSHGGLEDQWKRRTVLQTGGSFAALFNGLRSLMRNLQGSVAVQLISQFSPDNSGVLSFCTAFLSGEPATRLRVHELQQLIAVLFEFMAVCKHAIRVHFRLIGEEDQEFHTQLVKGFQSLTAE
ncbi:hypothetical protein FNV43_RR21547 [Rhamnella rubrinervis]|uniref:F-box domain-containing protein n=1 Tax=Rhamnella rubrinervis TaxID=2594499 RepID=A0A8K0DWE3_9ROSA|nr:hypothetical protein FNV43_RR21547 [Rhamnella rubrinervis]